MLINTVIVFLRDALPIFVLVAYLYAHLSASKRWLLLCLTVGSVLTLIYTSQIHFISELVDGKGIEAYLWISQLLVYLLTLCLGYGLSRNQFSHQFRLLLIAGVMVCLTLVSKGSYFILYFDGYWQHSNALQSMLLGTFLGLGICLSLTTLLYLAALWLKQRLGLWATWSLLLIYAAGQLVNAFPLLEQVDLINESATVWNTQRFISNEFEFGHLFNVLFGYQATPSVTQITVYLFALALPLSVFYWLNLKRFTLLGNKP